MIRIRCEYRNIVNLFYHCEITLKFNFIVVTSLSQSWSWVTFSKPNPQKSPPNPTQPNTTHGWTRPMTNSALSCAKWQLQRWFPYSSIVGGMKCLFKRHVTIIANSPLRSLAIFSLDDLCISVVFNYSKWQSMKVHPTDVSKVSKTSIISTFWATSS